MSGDVEDSDLEEPAENVSESADDGDDAEAGPKRNPALGRLLLERSKLGTFLLLLNFILYYCRPQDTPFEFLGAVRLPLVVSVITALVCLSSGFRPSTYQLRVMNLFLGVEAIRTVIGQVIFPDFVVNDAWQRGLWLDLILQYGGLFAPIITFGMNAPALRKLVTVWAFTGGYLGLYVSAHGGLGPGGFVRDENDVGLALLMFLPVLLAYLTESKLPYQRRVAYLVAAAFVLIGVIRTVSRGAFVGLVCVLLYFFWRSRQKFALLVALGVFAIVAAPFVPATYWSEVKSIQDTDKGTAQERRHYWSVALRVFLDPQNTLTGVGMGNTRYRVGPYETVQDLQEWPSIAGRAQHSLYIQILGDLGVWGVLIMSALLVSSWRANLRSLRRIRQLTFAPQRSDRPDGDEDADAPRPARSADSLAVERELSFVLPFVMALNVSFVALLSAGTFLSILYYPHLWVLFVLSGGLALYVERLAQIVDDGTGRTKRGRAQVLPEEED